jgi:hypothetical protein
MKYILGLAFAFLMASGAVAQECPNGKDWFHPDRCYTPLIAINWGVAPQSGPGPQAVQLTDFTLNTVYRQVQCEIGRLAIDAKRYSLPADLKARFKYSASHSLSLKAGLSAELGIKIARILEGPGVSINWSSMNAAAETVQSDFNVFGANTQACSKGRRPPVNVYSCLSQKLDFIQRGLGNCFFISEAVGKLSANGKVIIWFVNVGPTFEWDVKKSYTVAVSAPPQDNVAGLIGGGDDNNKDKKK